MTEVTLTDTGFRSGVELKTLSGVWDVLRDLSRPGAVSLEAQQFVILFEAPGCSSSTSLSHTYIHTHLPKYGTDGIWYSAVPSRNTFLFYMAFLQLMTDQVPEESSSLTGGKNWRFPPQLCAFKTFFNALSHPNSLELKRKFLLDIIKCLIAVKHTFGTLTWYEGSNNNLAKTLNDFKNTIHLLVECEKQIIFLQCDTSWKPLCLLKTQYYVPAFYTGGF